MDKFIAHYDIETSRKQSIKDHLTGTAEKAAEFADVFGAKTLGYRCGMLHDIGKYSSAFQKRILDNGPKVDHSTAGAIEAFRLKDVCSAFCIAGHHAGLPDGGNFYSSTAQDSTLLGRLKQKPGKEIYDYSPFASEISVPPAECPRFPENKKFSAAFFTRMLFSCLVDADFLDTESFMSNGSSVRGGYDKIHTLLELLEKYIASWWNAETDLNRKRCEILRTCLDAGANRRGLYSLTVPTGGGKTVSSLAFALRHADIHGMRRIIYIIPYTNIIEQTAQVFAGIVGEENVVAHYSGSEYNFADTMEDDAAALRRRAASENWDAPLIVTTSVQFFESLFSNKSSRCRKIHNIAGSVLIFDEAQMMPVSYLKPCVASMAELVQNYGCTAVLCTATQPSLNGLFFEYEPSLHAEELCKNTEELFKSLKRVNFQNEGRLTDSELSDRLNTFNQVLCIVNSREQAQSIFSLIKSEASFHLSTLMTPYDRSWQLKKIRKRLSEGLPCKVVSTSMIEAGVDVDFPVVFRAEAGLDSILQAAGRCNRENKHPASVSIVHVFESEKPAPRLFSQNIASFKNTVRVHADYSTPEAIRSYFDFLFKIKGSFLDQNGIMDAWENGLNGSMFPFASVAEEFRLIDSPTRPVYIPRAHGRELVARLENGERSRTLFRELGKFSVSIYSQHFCSLAEVGAIRILDDGVAVLADIGLYNDKTGLSLKADEGKGLFT